MSILGPLIALAGVSFETLALMGERDLVDAARDEDGSPRDEYERERRRRSPDADRS